MIDTDNVKGKYCSNQEMIFYLNAVWEAKQLRKGIEQALVLLNTSAIAAKERLEELIE